MKANPRERSVCGIQPQVSGKYANIQCNMSANIKTSMRVVICSHRTIADEHDLVNATKGAEQVLQIALRGREAQTEGADNCALGWAVL